MASAVGFLRIGELARRTGVSPELLRAWEQRYGLLQPSRSEGGFRLYSVEDERRVRRTTELIGRGLSASEAAKEALAPGPSSEHRPAPTDLAAVEDLRFQLRTSLDELDAEGAHRAFDRLLATFSVDAVLRDVVLPYLRELGDRWVRGEVSVAQEHFASDLIRGRLLGLGRGWGAGDGPTVLLACAPGERHDLGLIAFGIEIASRGWRVIFLGADTPIDTIVTTARATGVSLVMLGVTDVRHLRAQEEAIRALAGVVPIVLGGKVTQAEAETFGAQSLMLDPISAARAIARDHQQRTS